jgi:hypothetical protein
MAVFILLYGFYVNYVNNFENYISDAPDN